MSARRAPALFSAWLAALSLLWATASPAASAPSSTDLTARLDAILADQRLAGTQFAVSVRSADTDTVLYGSNAVLHLPAASNAKLLTSATALAALGADYTFRTTVLATAPALNGRVDGDLYLRGTGDPTLVASRFDELAAAVAARGIAEIRGDLVADDTWFDAERLGFDWSQQDEQFAYAAPISALSVAPDPDFNAGSVQVDIAPGSSVGAAAVVGFTPPTSVLELRNNATTGPRDSARQLGATRKPGTSELVVDGTLPLGGRASHPLRSVEDPTLYAADVFRASLLRHSVAIDGRIRRGSVPTSAVALADTVSMPLRDLLVPWLKLSNNPISEILVKSIGRHAAAQGSWQAGLEVVRRFAEAYGVEPDNLQLVDGSGLSTADLIAPDDLTQVLVSIQNEPWFETWYAALPIAGEPGHLVGGTLAERMVDTPAADNVHAKTGTLTTTSALSGYVTTAAGQRLAFSIVANGVIGPPPTEVEDAIAEELAAWPDPL